MNSNICKEVIKLNKEKEKLESFLLWSYNAELTYVSKSWGSHKIDTSSIESLLKKCDEYIKKSIDDRIKEIDKTIEEL